MKHSAQKLWNLVGKTPLVEIPSLSQLTGCSIFGKAEFLNPGGSIKDRAARSMILDAEQKGLLKENGTIVEGSAGNTGIGLATLARHHNYKVIITMPNNQAQEKVVQLESLGAKVIQVPPCPFANPLHFYHQAKRIAEENNFFWANQFENLSNFQAHYDTTGPEIWDQTHGKIDYFFSAVGTGGTISGVSNSLKEKNKNIQIILVDPMGSGLFSYVKNKEIKSEGSSITEGIGIMRLTANFSKAKIDDALQVTDQEMLNMLYFIAKEDGLLVGTSSALNLAGIYKWIKLNNLKNKSFVTTLCDHGMRYQSKVLNPAWLAEKNLLVQSIDS